MTGDINENIPEGYKILLSDDIRNSLLPIKI